MRQLPAFPCAADRVLPCFSDDSMTINAFAAKAGNVSLWSFSLVLFFSDVSMLNNLKSPEDDALFGVDGQRETALE